MGSRGLGDVGTWGRGDVGTWGRGDVGKWGRGARDAETRGRAGTRGSDKQTTPNFCAEFVRYNFRWSRESYHMQESLLVVADGFQRPWFDRICLLAYLTVRTPGTDRSPFMGWYSTQGVLNC